MTTIEKREQEIVDEFFEDKNKHTITTAVRHIAHALALAEKTAEKNEAYEESLEHAADSTEKRAKHSECDRFELEDYRAYYESVISGHSYINTESPDGIRFRELIKRIEARRNP